MKSRFTGLFVALACLALANPGGAGEKMTVTKKTIKADDGVNLVCEIRGKGDTTLLFLHGWCGDRQYWKDQADVFARDFQVITLDQAGHGESGKDRKTWTTSSLAGDVETIVKELGLKRVIIVGHSMGGPVGLMAAKRLPGKVIAVVGVDTIQNVEAKKQEEMVKKMMESFETNFKATIEMGMAGMVHDKTKPDVTKWIASRAASQDQRMAIGLMRDMMGLNQAAILKDAKVPVRCINSSGGFKFHTPTDADVNKKYADFQVVLMENVGHYPMLEQPEAFNTKLREVLKEFAK